MDFTLVLLLFIFGAITAASAIMLILEILDEIIYTIYNGK